MMEVKGTPVAAMTAFVRDKFGEARFRRWLNTLSSEAREVHSHGPDVGIWYPLRNMMTQPLLSVCVLFYGGDPKGAWECGRYTAERDLGEVLKMFGASHSLEGLVKIGGNVLATFFKPSPKVDTRIDGKSGMLQVREFQEMDKFLQFYIAGWVERALEFIGLKDVVMKVAKSSAKGDEYTEYRASWE